MRSSAGLLRRVLAALGLAAALTILLQPICSAYESAQAPGSGAACCLEMPPDAVVAAPSTAPEKALAPVSAPVSPLPCVAFMPPAVFGRLAVWKDPPPPSPSYHARSARIQR